MDQNINITIELSEPVIADIIAEKYGVTSDDVRLVAKPYWIEATVTVHKLRWDTPSSQSR